MHLTQDRLKTFATLLEDQIDQTWTVVLWRDHWNRLKKLAADSNEFKTTSSTLMGIPVIVVEDVKKPVNRMAAGLQIEYQFHVRRAGDATHLFEVPARRPSRRLQLLSDISN